MSDELAALLVEGTIVDDRPFTDAGEAQTFMNQTLGMLRRGVEVEQDGQRLQQEAADLLLIGAQRQVWKPLGFESWEECLTQGVAEVFNITIPRAARVPLVIELRNQGVNTENIAAALHVHSTTVLRDLDSARQDGLLDEEPDKVIGTDGRARPTTNNPPGRRPEFRKTWLNAVDALIAKTHAIKRLRADDRYPARLGDITQTYGDFQRLQSLIEEILRDFTVRIEAQKYIDRSQPSEDSEI